MAPLRQVTIDDRPIDLRQNWHDEAVLADRRADAIDNRIILDQRGREDQETVRALAPGYLATTTDPQEREKRGEITERETHRVRAAKVAEINGQVYTMASHGDFCVGAMEIPRMVVRERWGDL
jgi:hypothetical protein